MNAEKELITSRKNAEVLDVCALLDKKGREREGRFRFDGIKLFLEAAASAPDAIETIFIKESEKDKIIDTVERAFARNGGRFTGRVLVLSDFVFDKITEEKGAQGIVCTARYLDGLHTRVIKEDSEDVGIPDGEKIMALSSVRDPGNIGTLMRTASAFGIDRLILSSDCADVYNPKTIRASMGAIFRQKTIIADDLAALLSALKHGGRRILAADPDASALPMEKAGLSASDCIVIGNEGHGISDDVLDVCDTSVFIPISSSTESLNASVAGAVFMWEMSKL